MTFRDEGQPTVRRRGAERDDVPRGDFDTDVGRSTWGLNIHGKNGLVCAMDMAGKCMRGSDMAEQYMKAGSWQIQGSSLTWLTESQE